MPLKPIPNGLKRFSIEKESVLARERHETLIISSRFVGTGTSNIADVRIVWREQTAATAMAPLNCFVGAFSPVGHLLQTIVATPTPSASVASMNHSVTLIHSPAILRKKMRLSSRT